MHFNYYMPTRVIFGRGRLKELAQAQAELPGKKALIVITGGNSMRKFGYLDKVQALLRENGVDSTVFDKVLPNPIEAHVEEAAELARREECDFVIGLGGGSSIDSAKSIAIMVNNGDNRYWDYLKGKASIMQPVYKLQVINSPSQLLGRF